MKKPQEIALQSRCVYAFNNTYCLTTSDPRLVIYTVPNEISSGTPTQRARELQLKIASGMLGGVADLTILAPNGNVLFIEMKLPTNYQQQNQKDFQDRVTLLGFEYVVIKTEEDFELIVNDWLKRIGVEPKPLKWMQRKKK